MSKKTLIFNTDELLYDFFTKKHQLWLDITQREGLELKDAFFMAYYDAHLEKKEKALREYRELAPFAQEFDQSFQNWLINTDHKSPQTIQAFMQRMAQNFDVIFVTHQKPEFMKALLDQEGYAYVDVFSTKQVLNAKPEADIYLKIARFLKMKPNDLYVVDSTLNGVQASYLAHAKGIYIAQYGPASPTIEKFSTILVDDLVTLENFLLKLV